MDKIRCVIVDDEPIAQRILESFVGDVPELILVDVFKNALDARTLIESGTIDLMFLDLEMPRLKGLAFLRTLTNPPAVIITTAHREFALESYELEVLDYLLKPVSFERFLKAVKRFQKVNGSNSNSGADKTYLYVKSNRKIVKIKREDILFIEGMNNYVKIICEGHSHMVYASLNAILKELNDDFLRVHKSFIVNRHQIRSFSRELVEIRESQIPIGKNYLESVYNRF